MIKANDVPALVNINQVEPIYVTFMVPQQYRAVKQYSRNGLPVQAVIPSDSRGTITGKLYRQRSGFRDGYDQTERVFANQTVVFGPASCGCLSDAEDAE
jgi:hypothetical protein